LLVKFT